MLCSSCVALGNLRIREHLELLATHSISFMGGGRCGWDHCYERHVQGAVRMSVLVVKPRARVNRQQGCCVTSLRATCACAPPPPLSGVVRSAGVRRYTEHSSRSPTWMLSSVQTLTQEYLRACVFTCLKNVLKEYLTKKATPHHQDSSQTRKHKTTLKTHDACTLSNRIYFHGKTLLSLSRSRHHSGCKARWTKENCGFLPSAVKGLLGTILSFP